MYTDHPSDPIGSPATRAAWLLALMALVVVSGVALVSAASSGGDAAADGGTAAGDEADPGTQDDFDAAAFERAIDEETRTAEAEFNQAVAEYLQAQEAARVAAEAEAARVAAEAEAARAAAQAEAARVAAEAEAARATVRHAGAGRSSEAQWAALRNCESSGNYGAVSASGRYRGAYQFSQATWNSVAAAHHPWLVNVDPATASAADQDAQARALYAMSGRGQWPHCGRHLS